QWAVIKNYLLDPLLAAVKALAGVFKTIESMFTSAFNSLKGIVSRGVAGIASIWNTLKDKLQGPVTYFVNTIIGKWIVGNINRVLSFLKLPTIPVPSISGGGSSGGSEATRTDPTRGGGAHGLARGGPVPGSGDGDTVPAMLTPGEFVIRKSAVKALGLDFLHSLNAQRFAGGGLVDILKDIGSAAGNVIGKVANFGKEGILGGAKLLLAPIKSALANMGKTGLSGLMGGSGLFVINQVLN